MEENRSSSEKKGDRPRKNKHYDLNVKILIVRSASSSFKWWSSKINHCIPVRRHWESPGSQPGSS